MKTTTTNLSLAQTLSLMPRADLLALETATYDAEEFDAPLANAIRTEMGVRCAVDKAIIENARGSNYTLDTEDHQALASGAW